MRPLLLVLAALSGAALANRVGKNCVGDLATPVICLRNCKAQGFTFPECQESE